MFACVNQTMVSFLLTFMLRLDSNVSLVRVIFQNNNSVIRCSIQSPLFNISNEFLKFHARRSFVRIISSLVSWAPGPGPGNLGSNS